MWDFQVASFDADTFDLVNNYEDEIIGTYHINELEELYRELASLLKHYSANINNNKGR